MPCRTPAALVLVLLAALVAGCRGGQGAAPPPDVPWAGQVPAELVPHPVAPAPRCRAARLRVLGAGLLFQPAAGGGGTGTLRLRNAGAAPCRLDGRPGVAFVGASPAPAQRQVALGAGTPPFPALLPPAAGLLALPPGGVATLGVDWRNWCEPGTRPVPPRAARLTLPGGGGVLEVGYSAVTSCVDPARPSTVGVRPFQPAPLATPGAWTPLRVQAAIEPAPHARRGQPATYTVELRNASTTGTLRFDRCPTVAQYLAPAGATEAHLLNCAAARPLPPGAALRFQMRLVVPAGAPLGPNGLFWALDATGSQPLEVVSRLVVDG
jgi:Domain of unknown function (DUF4232)